jgi:hypothetical protein
MTPPNYSGFFCETSDWVRYIRPATANRKWMSRNFFFLSAIFPLKNEKSLARPKNYIKNSVGYVLNLLLPRSLGLPGLISHSVDVCILVKSGHRALKSPCPLYPQKQTSFSTVAMSALCHYRTLAQPIRSPRWRHAKPSWAMLAPTRNVL